LSEQGARFGACALPRKQPVIVAATEYEGPEVVDVFIDHSSEILLKGIFEPDSVLDVVVWKGQPVVRIRPAGLDQVDPEPDAHEIGKAHRRHR